MFAQKSAFTLIELMIVISLIGIVMVLFQDGGVSEQKKLQNSQRIARSIESILTTNRLATSLGKGGASQTVISISTGSIKKDGAPILQTPFFDNDARYEITDIKALSGTTSQSFSGAILDIIYKNDTTLAFSGTVGSFDAQSATGVEIQAGYA